MPCGAAGEGYRTQNHDQERNSHEADPNHGCPNIHAALRNEPDDMTRSYGSSWVTVATFGSGSSKTGFPAVIRSTRSRSATTNAAPPSEYRRGPCRLLQARARRHASSHRLVLDAPVSQQQTHVLQGQFDRDQLDMRWMRWSPITLMEGNQLHDIGSAAVEIRQSSCQVFRRCPLWKGGC